MLSNIKPKPLLSSLWVFVFLNYIYADIITIMYNQMSLKQNTEAATLNGIELNETFFLGSAVYLEILMIMVILSLLLNYKANKMANIIVGILATLGIIVSLFVGKPTSFYIFFASVEIATTLFIVWFAWNWKDLKTERN